MNGSTPIYSLSGPSSGLINHAGNGNVKNITDSVNGTWTYNYDGVTACKLRRLAARISITPTPPTGRTANTVT